LQHGYTPLLLAAKEGDEEIMSVLLERGANIDAKETVNTCIDPENTSSILVVPSY
jgi:ankyrin repeat protein